MKTEPCNDCLVYITPEGMFSENGVLLAKPRVYTEAEKRQLLNGIGDAWQKRIDDAAFMWLTSPAPPPADEPRR